MPKKQSQIASVLKEHEKDLLTDWIAELKSAGAGSQDRISDAELQQQAKEFLKAMQEASQSGNLADIGRPEWSRVLQLLEEISRTRALQGFSSSQTATFI
ncbi:MAG TPA: RsbRD N-terminal domain-containing protein, partial [Planctomycetaceae bacterium]|nr:RsbRD N-terminal domain-containing protein [Planctomycetaceae bacterium]